MRPIDEIKKSYRLSILGESEDGMDGYIVHPGIKPGAMTFVASWAGGWDHVSAGFRRRCPTWDEMCMIKNIFFSEDEVCVQFHPQEDEYINEHPYILHIWKPQEVELPTPPAWMVGRRPGQSMNEVFEEAKEYFAKRGESIQI